MTSVSREVPCTILVVLFVFSAVAMAIATCQDSRKFPDDRGWRRFGYAVTTIFASGAIAMAAAVRMTWSEGLCRRASVAAAVSDQNREPPRIADVETRQSSEPFVRNRHRWALGFWVVVVLLNVEALTDGWRGVVSFIGSAMIYGVIAYMAGSHKNRDDAAFWRPLVPVWAFILAATVAWAVYLSVADGEVAWRAAGSLILQGLLAALVVVAYRRTSDGKPWRPTPHAVRTR